MSRLLPAPAGGAPSGAPTPLGDLALQMPKLTRRITAVHGALFLRAQNGPLARWFGASILVLETVGRRTGRLRATPLAYVSHGDDLVVVPANAGADLAPAWWLNLQAAGQGVAILDNQRRNVRPRVAADTEHQQLWQRLATVAPIDHYQRRTRRPLPIVVLEPPASHAPHRELIRRRRREHGERRTQMIKWAGRLIVLYGAAHTLGALTAEGAARHAGAWFSGELWRDDLANMSPANSALWLSVDSFGVPLIVVGLMVLWLDRRGITPPPFIAWTLGTWTVVDAVILLLTPWPILLLANILLLVGARRARHRDSPTPASVT